MRPNNLVGAVFGRLVVLKDGGRNKKKNILWQCRCACGGETLALAYDLRAGKVKSCGCLSREGNHTTHGQGRTGNKRNPTYSIWASMVQRCTNPRDRNWGGYGGRGISVCEEWFRFENFYADMGDKPPSKSLDRQDNNSGYSAQNCRWVSHKDQNRNKRSNVLVTIDGKTQILQDWCDYLQISRQAVYYWIKKGFSHGDAIKRISRKK